jgi:hypothetical protein
MATSVSLNTFRPFDIATWLVLEIPIAGDATVALPNSRDSLVPVILHAVGKVVPIPKSIDTCEPAASLGFVKRPTT